MFPDPFDPPLHARYQLLHVRRCRAVHCASREGVVNHCERPVFRLACHVQFRKNTNGKATCYGTVYHEK